MKKKLISSVFVVVVFLSLVFTHVVVSSRPILIETALELNISTKADIFAPGAEELLAQGTNPVEIVIQTTTSDYSRISTMIEELGGVVKIEYDSIDAIAATIPSNNLDDLANSPAVHQIYSDPIQYLQESAKGITPVDNIMGMDPGMASYSVDVSTLDTVPYGYANPTLTMANAIWSDEDVNAGAGVKVAIIDTGCWHQPWVDPDFNVTHYPWYWGNVYDGVDISYDVGDPTYEGYDNPMNHYHGTFCASLLAAHVELIFSPGHLWAESILYYYPDAGYVDDLDNIHIFSFGIAPAASIYAVKVFDHTGGGVPSSIVMDGIDHAIMEGVDVISMSLGGGVGAPGVDPSDLLVDAATEAGITVVIAAGNEGPAQLRVGSPGTAKTAITVGAAIDPIHHKVAGGIIYGYPPYGELVYYPHNEKSIAYFSSRGPTSDGRIKPDVVATGYWTFGQLTPARWPSTLSIGGGTSYSCPQVAGEAVLLTAYIKNNNLDLGPKEVKKAIMQGAEPIDGFEAFEQGAGYINCYNSLEILKNMEESHCYYNNYKWRHYCHCNCYYWSPPINTLYLRHGKTIISDIILDPLKFKYFAFWVDSYVDSIKVTLSGVEFASPEQQNLIGDSGYLYLSTSARDGVGEYLINGEIFYDVDPEVPDEFVFQATSDAAFQPGLIRLALEGDFTSYQPITIDEIIIEVVEVEAFKIGPWMSVWNFGVDIDEAQVSIYDGDINTEKGKIKETETDIYHFTIPDSVGTAIVELSWKKDWTRWGTSDLDMLIFGPSGLNDQGVTGSSPEVAFISEPGDYEIWVEGYQVYWGKNEIYTLRIIYIADPVPIWESEIFTLDCWFKFIRLPKGVKGLAVVSIHDLDFDYWYTADQVKV